MASEFFCHLSGFQWLWLGSSADSPSYIPYNHVWSHLIIPASSNRLPLSAHHQHDVMSVAKVDPFMDRNMPSGFSDIFWFSYSVKAHLFNFFLQSFSNSFCNVPAPQVPGPSTKPIMFYVHHFILATVLFIFLISRGYRTIWISFVTHLLSSWLKWRLLLPSNWLNCHLSFSCCS